MSSNAKRVLVVDDNNIMRSLLRAILRNEERFEVVGEAGNGIAAVELTERVKPDIVCLDVMMPEMDGLEALRAIKSSRPETVVVMITANASAENVQEAVKLGANGFVIKPFNAAKVLDTLTALSR